MGEIADSMINGEFDQFTGEYIGKPCGYPRSKTNNALATNGVYMWIYKKYADIKKEDADRLVIEYANTVLGLPKEIKVKTACKHISLNFPKFTHWFSSNLS